MGTVVPPANGAHGRKANVNSPGSGNNPESILLAADDGGRRNRALFDEAYEKGTRTFGR